MRVTVVDGPRTRELRRAVLRPNWPIGSAMPGDDDPAAVHLAAISDDGRVLGACVLFPAPFPDRPDAPGAWQLRGMATAPDEQRRGVGALVLGGAVAEVLRRGGSAMWCNARTSAVPFYRRHGFVVVGEEFVQEETGLPHYRMWRELGRPR